MSGGPIPTGTCPQRGRAVVGAIARPPLNERGGGANGTSGGPVRTGDVPIQRVRGRGGDRAPAAERAWGAMGARARPGGGSHGDVPVGWVRGCGGDRAPGAERAWGAMGARARPGGGSHGDVPVGWVRGRGGDRAPGAERAWGAMGPKGTSGGGSHGDVPERRGARSRGAIAHPLPTSRPVVATRPL